jgi:hypothetical protein
MSSPSKRDLCLIALVGVATWSIVAGGAYLPCFAEPQLKQTLQQPSDARVVIVASGLSPEDLVVHSSAAAASARQNVFLLSSPSVAKEIDRFINDYKPSKVVQVGETPLPARSGSAPLSFTIETVPAEAPFPVALWRRLGLRTSQIVVCPKEPRRSLLEAACLAGAMHAPLCVLHGRPEEAVALDRLIAAGGTEELLAIGEARKMCRKISGVRHTTLPDEKSVANRYLSILRGRGPIKTLVLANACDSRLTGGGLSNLAPWVALQRHAVLLLTNQAGDNVRELVDRAKLDKRLERAESILFVADMQAIPGERRPNPAPGKDTEILAEPLTPTGWEPFTFATGRLFHKSPEWVPLLLARQRLLESSDPAAAIPRRRAMVVSNPAGGLPLLETFSRNTASEFRNAGYETIAIYGDDVTPGAVRKLLPEQDIFLWEGHHSTMSRDYGLPNWPEPLSPSLIFLQSCLALCEEDALPLLGRGAVAVVGSSSRTYSASGGACSLAFFDSLLYEDQSVGASLRHAKNFLLAYGLLKEKRLGGDTKLRGASIRSAWAFSLWGDPTMKVPHPTKPAEGLLTVHHEVHGNTIELRQPAQPHQRVVSEQYETQMLPNARIAGLVQRKGDGSERQLVPLLFAEVRMPKAPLGTQPRLRSRIPEDHWVFNYDERRNCGYLLVTPRTKDTGNLRFQIHWERKRSEW